MDLLQLFCIVSTVAFLQSAFRHRTLRLLVDDEQYTQFFPYRGKVIYGIILKFYGTADGTRPRMKVWWPQLGLKQIWLSEDIYWNGWCWEDNWRDRPSDTTPEDIEERIQRQFEEWFDSIGRKMVRFR